MKALKLAGTLGIEYVITTEHAGSTAWARNLSYEQRIFTIAEKLYEPLRLAGDLGVKLLFEPHGPVSDTIQGIKDVRAALTTMTRRLASAWTRETPGSAVPIRWPWPASFATSSVTCTGRTCQKRWKRLAVRRPDAVFQPSLWAKV